MNKNKSQIILSKPPILNRPRTGHDIRQAGGEDCLKKTMINHYKALLKIKPQIDVSEPHPHVKKSLNPVSYLDENIVVRNTYKGVANIKNSILHNSIILYNLF